MKITFLATAALLAALVSPLPAQAPANDDCSAAIAIAGPASYAFDTANATTSSQQSGMCPSAGFDIWYAYTASSGGTATITTCGSMTSAYLDTVIAIWAGPGCPTGPVIACVDDASCTPQSSLTSTLSWPIACGQTYLIQMGQFSGAAAQLVGSFVITEAGTSCGSTGVPFCFGDGTGTACPCANNGAPGNGCASSVNASGASLDNTGQFIIGSDTAVLHGTGMPNSSALYFQGTTAISALFGDGLRCVVGNVIRLGTETNVAGASHYPAAGDPPISVKGGVTVPGSVRRYQVWYRNAASFCTASTFNLTNGIAFTWQ